MYQQYPFPGTASSSLPKIDSAKAGTASMRVAMLEDIVEEMLVRSNATGAFNGHMCGAVADVPATIMYWKKTSTRGSQHIKDFPMGAKMTNVTVRNKMRQSGGDRGWRWVAWANANAIDSIRHG
jgi:hypothetical protein